MILNCRYHVHRIIVSDISLKLDALGYIFLWQNVTFILNNFYAMRPGSCRVWWNNANYGLFRFL